MPSRKRVLLITYYWPPAGGAGVQRWLKMSKHLQQRFDLTVYHPDNADYPITDTTLTNEIPSEILSISKPIKEPYALARKLNPKLKNYQKGQIEPEREQSTLSKAALWIRANMFIPDARVGWIKPSVAFLKKYLVDHPQDIIITTGPPHSMHVIGLKLKQIHPNIKWIADFRDPWTEIDYFGKLPLTKRSIRKHKKLEANVLKTANVVTTVSPSWAQELSKIAEKEVKVIYNGFDKKDFVKKVKTKDAFTFTYIGSLNDDRNPTILWKVLEDLCQEESFRNKLQLKLIGNISPYVKQEIKSYTFLNSKTIFIDYLPHGEAVQALMESQILLLLINETANEKGIIPGKFFEYLAANRTILCIGKEDSDIELLLNKVKAGILVDRYNSVRLKDAIQIWFHEYENNLLNQSTYQNTSMYSRKKAALDFAQIIEKL